MDACLSAPATRGLILGGGWQRTRRGHGSMGAKKGRKFAVSFLKGFLRRGATTHS